MPSHEFLDLDFDNIVPLHNRERIAQYLDLVETFHDFDSPVLLVVQTLNDADRLLESVEATDRELGRLLVMAYALDPGRIVHIATRVIDEHRAANPEPCPSAFV